MAGKRKEHDRVGKGSGTANLEPTITLTSRDAVCVEFSDLTASTLSLHFSIPRRQHLINSVSKKACCRTSVLMPVSDQPYCICGTATQQIPLTECWSSGVARCVGWLDARRAVFGECFQLWRGSKSGVGWWQVLTSIIVSYLVQQ